MNKAKGDSRNESLLVKMSEKEKKEVQKAADDMGVTMSAFARIVLKDFMKKSNC